MVMARPEKCINSQIDDGNKTDQVDEFKYLVALMKRKMWGGSMQQISNV